MTPARMKLADFEVIFSGTDEQWRTVNRWENLSPGQQAGETAEAWNQWMMASCAERNGGHCWQLDWEEDDGLDLYCLWCPAGVDELYPDGMDVLSGELPAGDGRVLRIDSGSIPLDTPVREWHGPVRARVEQEYHPGGPWGGPERDAWVVVEAAP